MDAKVICDSVNPIGIRLITLQLEYPRFIHSEFLTHRVFSRNASSSRAIPITKMIERVRRSPAMPCHWGKNQKGMQADNEIDDASKAEAKKIWLEAMGNAIQSVEKLNQLGVHKQIANRLLEPFAYIQVVVSATEWENFFELRAHKDAQPEIQALALKIQEAIEASTPKQLKIGEWHLPYITDEERKSLTLIERIKTSAARCARVSYLLHDGNPSNLKADLELHDRLVSTKPIHASPTEHQAMALGNDSWCKNFRGWKQYRFFVENGMMP